MSKGRAEGTSGFGHRLLALHHGWSPGVFGQLLTQGVEAGCTSPGQAR
jgi:hypothetical protein